MTIGPGGFEVLVPEEPDEDRLLDEDRIEGLPESMWRALPPA